jgi:hypothetical protein
MPEPKIVDQIIALLDGYTIHDARELLKEADDMLMKTLTIKRTMSAEVPQPSQEPRLASPRS